MKLKDEVGWKQANEANPPSKSYGHRVITYAEDWANLMEERIAQGETVEQCAKETSRQADTDGITGFMYGAAVLTLAQVWAPGEALRRWHNIDTQIGKEGEKANESGGTLNPALLNITTI